MTVLKATHRSRRMRTDDLESGFSIHRASVTDSSAVSVEWPLLKPNCLASSLLFWEINNEIWLKATHSIVFTMNGRRETGLQFSIREVFNVGFLSSGVTRACLNAVGKMPVRRDVLILCLSAGKSVGEIAWRMCKGIGSRGHVVEWLERRSLDSSTSVRGQKEKMGV